MRPEPHPSSSEIQVEEHAPQAYFLTVTFDGRRFDCGTYISRAAATQAGRLFVSRKEGERVSQGKRPRKNKK